MKYKWTYEGNKSFRQIVIILGGTLPGEILVGRKYLSNEIFVTFLKISPDKVWHPILKYV